MDSFGERLSELFVITRVAFFTPMAVGENLTMICLVAPVAKSNEWSVGEVIEYSVGFNPSRVISLIVTAIDPVFCSVMVLFLPVPILISPYLYNSVMLLTSTFVS